MNEEELKQVRAVVKEEIRKIFSPILNIPEIRAALEKEGKDKQS